MAIDKFEKTIDALQHALVWFVIMIITVCIAVLILFDVLAGTGTMMYLTGGKEWQSAVLSLATTGLLFALMFIGYMMSEKSSNSVVKLAGKGIGIISAIIYCQDIVFDALLADVLRYGTIYGLNVDSLQWMFRSLIGGVSTVGDALAIMMIIGMPALKSIIKGALGGKVETPRPTPHVVQPKPISESVAIRLPKHKPQEQVKPKREEYKPIPTRKELVDKPEQPEPDMDEDELPPFLRQAMKSR